MKKQYNKRNKKSTGKKDQEALETVTVELPLPIAEILAGVEVEIEELAGRAGMLIIEYAMASEVDRRAGRRYAHMLDRENFRWGTQKGSIVYAGRKVEIDRPRVRSASGQEVPLATYQAFSQGEKMKQAVYDKLILGVSSRNYEYPSVITKQYNGFSLPSWYILPQCPQSTWACSPGSVS